jgi:hypothetical protein
MTSQPSVPTAERQGAASARVEPEPPALGAHGDSPLDDPRNDDPRSDGPASGLERSERGENPMRQTGAFPKAAARQPEGSLDSAVVDELTRRLPTAELVKIIKGALECGRRNLPFTESDFLRAMTFGASALPTRQPPRGNRTPRG